MTGFRKIKSHSADTRTLRIIPGLKELMEKAVLIQQSDDSTGNENVKYWLTYASRAVLDGESVFVKLVVREERNGTRLLDFFDDSSVSKITIRQGAASALDLVPTTNRLGYEIRTASNG